MYFLNKISIRFCLIVLLVSSACCLQAEENESYYYCTDTGGCGYEENCRASYIAPAVALTTIAVVAIVAVAVQNPKGSSSSHFHN